MKWLNGYKTHLGFIVLGLIGIACMQGWISQELAATAASIVGAWTGIAIRSAMKKIEKANCIEALTARAIKETAIAIATCEAKKKIEKKA